MGEFVFWPKLCYALGLVVTREWAQLHAERNWCHSGLRLVPLLFFLSQRHWSCDEPQSSPPPEHAACVLSSDDRRSASGRCLSAPLFRTVGAPRFVSLFFLARPPVRPSAVAKQLIIKVSCLLPHFPPTRIHSLSHSLSLAEKLLNSCCHARQRTVLKVAEPLLSPSSETRAFHSDSGKCRLLQLSLQHICQNCSAAICVSLLSLVSDSHSFGLFLPFLGCFCTASCRFSLCT